MPGDPFQRAAAALVVLNVYLQVVEWIDLTPWNNVRNGNGQEMLDIALGAGMLALALMLLARWRWAAWAASAGLAAWIVLQIQTWWLPYFLGASPGWERTYAKWFAGNVQVLPSSPGRLAPDANHLVLQAVILLAAAACLAAAVSKAPGRGPDRFRASL